MPLVDVTRALPNFRYFLGRGIGGLTVSYVFSGGHTIDHHWSHLLAMGKRNTTNTTPSPSNYCGSDFVSFSLVRPDLHVDSRGDGSDATNIVVRAAEVPARIYRPTPVSIVVPGKPADPRIPVPTSAPIRSDLGDVISVKPIVTSTGITKVRVHKLHAVLPVYDVRIPEP